jgi:hypothetical protein
MNEDSSGIRSLSLLTELRKEKGVKHEHDMLTTKRWQSSFPTVRKKSTYAV